MVRHRNQHLQLKAGKTMKQKTTMLAFVVLGLLMSPCAAKPKPPIAQDPCYELTPDGYKSKGTCHPASTYKPKLPISQDPHYELGPDGYKPRKP